MREIEQIYFNDFGVAFHWKKNNEVFTDKVQMVFKETGFYLSFNELKAFAQIIDNTCEEMDCEGCLQRSRCHKFLLKTPLQQIDLAVSKNELLQIKDLVQGTIFNMDLFDYINDMCKN
jgi:ABC-type dipeptide/oligopeptide/nickel transport system ATPase subunit